MIAFRHRRFVVVVFFLSLPFLFDKAGYESFCFMHPMIHIFQTKKEPSSGTANCFQCRHHMGLPNGVCNSTRNHLFLAFNTTSYVASSQGLRAGDVVSITVTRALGGQYGLLPFSTSCPSSHRLQLWKLLIFLTVSSTLLLLPTKPFSLDLEQHFSMCCLFFLGRSCGPVSTLFELNHPRTHPGCRYRSRCRWSKRNRLSATNTCCIPFELDYTPYSTFGQYIAQLAQALIEYLHVTVGGQRSNRSPGRCYVQSQLGKTVHHRST